MILLLCITIIFLTFSLKVYADEGETSEADRSSADGILGTANDFINRADESPLDEDSLISLSQLIYNTLLSLGMIIAVIVGIILGIKYMTSSTGNKAKNKEHLVAYTVGCMILFGAFGVWELTVSLLQNSEEEIASTLPSFYDEYDDGDDDDSSYPNGGFSDEIIQKGEFALDKTVLMLDVNHYKTATLKCYNPAAEKITWKSSNSKVVTVSKKGKLVAKSAGNATITAKTASGKTATCKVTTIEKMKKVSANTKGAVPYVGIDKAFVSTYWKIKKVKWDKELLESYINNAEALCKTKDYSKYPEAKSGKLPYYTGSPGGDIYSGYGNLGTLSKHWLNKKVGLSATNYLILVTTTNQQINVFKKNNNGIWELKNTCETSTGGVSSGHNRFEFYLGAAYHFYGPAEWLTFMQFSQSGNGWHGKLPGLENSYPGYEQYSAHRAIHNGNIYPDGNPSSSGCVHISTKDKAFHDYLYKTLIKNNQYGTRIIVY